MLNINTSSMTGGRVWLWEGDEEMRFTGKLKRLMPRDLQERQARRGHQGRKLREVTFFSFFVESTCTEILAQKQNADGKRLCFQIFR